MPVRVTDVAYPKSTTPNSYKRKNVHFKKKRENAINFILG